MKKKKVIVTVVIVMLLIGVLTAAIVTLVKKNKEKNNRDIVYVESVANITGAGYYGNRYMGVVEAQESKSIQKDSEKVVKEIFVSVGDVVKEGDKLFEYDMEEMNLSLKRLELELTGIYNNITMLNQQIKDLAAERDTVPEENKIEYTSQIQSLQAQVNQENYNASEKQLEIDRQKAAMENTIVYAPMDGTIKEINNDTSDSGQNDYYEYYDYSGSGEKPFMSITALGDYRIKATADELNVRSMSEGDSIIIRSRIDESMIWYGTISLIDLEHPENGNEDYYYGMGGTGTTKYPFYIDLESTDELMLGQHVYVELDYGQGASRAGIWLEDYYVVMDDGNAYVWVEDASGKLEKRKVELGDYDEELWTYEIVSGLTEDDYIAYPEDRLREGMKTTHNYEEATDFDSDVNIDEDMLEEDFYDEDMLEEEYYDDGMMDEEFYEDGMFEEDMLMEEGVY